MLTSLSTCTAIQAKILQWFFTIYFLFSTFLHGALLLKNRL